MDALALNKLSYGLYILTTTVDGKEFGCIINTAFQITAEPPQIAVGCNHDNFTHDKIVKAQKFALSALATDTDPSLIATFGYKSGKDVDKFKEHPAKKGDAMGLPLFPDVAVATFECRLIKQLEVETHTIFVGEVVDCHISRSDTNEMTYRYYHEVLKGTTPKNAPTYIAEENDTSEKWQCPVCGYIYDGDIPFEELDDDWVCPVCGAAKGLFEKQ